MAEQNTYPSLEEFLIAPIEVISQSIPTTLIFASGGTRRSAALAGIELGDDFASWNRLRMLTACQLFFDHGVQHLIMPMGSPKMFAESGLYRKRLLQWINWGLAGDESITFYQKLNWHVKMIVVGETVPELANTAKTLAGKTGYSNGPYLWFIITPDFHQVWPWLARAFVGSTYQRSDVVKTLYGYNIPPASLLISFGKPLISLDILPPLLYEEIQCYWTQQPSYDLDEYTLRTILYDYAYLRPTWRRDKTGRAEEAIAYRDAWEQGPVIGLGMKVGPFWYPVPTQTPFDEVKNA